MKGSDLMKFVRSVSLDQTIHFPLKKELSAIAAKKEVQREVDRYKLYLQRNGSRYEVVNEQKEPDGSIVLHIRKRLGVVQGME